MSRRKRSSRQRRARRERLRERHEQERKEEHERWLAAPPRPQRRIWHLWARRGDATHLVFNFTNAVSVQLEPEAMSGDVDVALARALARTKWAAHGHGTTGEA